MMRSARALTILLLAISFSVGLLAQRGDEDLKKKQSQLEKLRKEIDMYEGRIKEKEKKEQATLDLLATYDRQNVLLRKLITKLHEQELSLQLDIDETKHAICELGGQLSFLKKHYANYVSTVYKYGRTYDLELLLSSNSFNRLLIRSEYLTRFSEQRKKDLERIGNRRSSLEEENLLLQKQLAEQQGIITEKQKEEGRLATKAKKRKSLLSEIRRDKKNYKRELDRKKQDIKELEQIIAKLIEEDRVRKEHEKNLAKGRKEPSREGVSGADFAARRGRLRWPVTHGKLTARFGNQQHPTLHTITQNTGIDITVPVGTDVEAVAEGEVSKIYWLPSFGNLIILNHQNGYRTVYAHLSEIAVNEGDKINEGDHIGKSGESLSGSVLHFEIYKDREKLDPELWLYAHGLSKR